MKPLTESEEVAKNWLERQGHKNVSKRSNKVGGPDFCADGEEFEVKSVLNGNYLQFTGKQFSDFKESNPKIIVVENGNVVDLFPFSELEDKEYDVYVEGRRSGIRPGIDISWSVHGAVKDYAEEKDMNLSEAYEELIERGIKNG